MDRQNTINATTLYRVWLPEGFERGIVETSPRFNSQYAGNSHYRTETRNISSIAQLGMAERFTEAGFTVTAIDETWRLTFPSLQKLIADTDTRAALAGPGISFFRFREYEGATFSSLEFITNLANGFVLVSNSLAPYIEFTDNKLNVRENHPRLLHDMLVHVPAWLCLPPAITSALQQAAQKLIAERSAALEDPARLQVIDGRIKEMMATLDQRINTYDIQNVRRLEPWNPLVGIGIGSITGKNSRNDALDYERLIRDWMFGSVY